MTAFYFLELSHQSDLGQQSVSLCEEDNVLDDSMSVSLFDPNQSGNTSQQRIQFPDNLSTAPPTSSTSSNQKDNVISEAPTTAPSVKSQSDYNDQDFDSANNEDMELDEELDCD